MDGLLLVADGIPIIEDCAQAHGAIRNGQRAGSFGVAGTFSFYPTKNLPAIGDAGAVVTSDPELARRMRGLRQYGWSDKYLVAVSGGRNSRLDEVQAAVLHDRLPMLDAWNAARRTVAERYVSGLSALPLELPAVGRDYAAHLFVVELDEREAMRKVLAAAGIETAVHFPIADHLQPGYPAQDPAAADLGCTERSCARVLSLPCFPGMTDDQVDQVIAAIAQFFMDADRSG
jgi:dTDP-4-amino-4,6-dideoxygalactose transaminase